MKHIIIAIIFMLFAALQLNDPDGWLWTIIYLCVGGVAFMYYRKIYYPTLIYLLILILGIYFITYLPDIMHWHNAGMPDITSEMKATTPYIELTREFIGLLLCLLVLITYARLIYVKTR